MKGFGAFPGCKSADVILRLVSMSNLYPSSDGVQAEPLAMVGMSRTFGGRNYIMFFSGIMYIYFFIQNKV